MFSYDNFENNPIYKSEFHISFPSYYVLHVHSKKTVPSSQVHREIKAVKIFYGPRTSKEVVKVSSYEQSMEIKSDIF